VALCVDDLDREINNGGFDQFFWNSSGDHAHETVRALEAIGAPQAAQIVREAIACFPAAVAPADRDQRADLMAKLPQSVRETWGTLDDRFYRYPDDLTALLRRYAAANRAGFRDWP
jgi:hypothetical protein